MRKMADQILVKFKKYWIEFSVVLAIAVVLDPRYKLPFLNWCYQKLYGYASSLQYLKVYEKIFALFGEYVSNVSAPSISSEMARQATQETEEQYANEGSLFMTQVCFFLFLFIYLYYVIYILPKLISIMLFLYVGI